MLLGFFHEILSVAFAHSSQFYIKNRAFDFFLDSKYLLVNGNQILAINY